MERQAHELSTSPSCGKALDEMAGGKLLSILGWAKGSFSATLRRVQGERPYQQERRVRGAFCLLGPSVSKSLAALAGLSWTGNSRGAYLLEGLQIFDDVGPRKHSDKVASPSMTGISLTPSRPIFSIAVHNSALGSILLSFSRGTMAWAAVLVVHEGRGISFTLCRVSNPTVWSPRSTRKHRRPCARTSWSTNFCNVVSPDTWVQAFSHRLRYLVANQQALHHLLLDLRSGCAFQKPADEGDPQSIEQRSRSAPSHTPTKIKRKPKNRPVLAAIRVARRKFLFTPQTMARKTRPPSKGNPGMRLNSPRMAVNEREILGHRQGRRNIHEHRLQKDKRRRRVQNW